MRTPSLEARGAPLLGSGRASHSPLRAPPPQTGDLRRLASRAVAAEAVAQRARAEGAAAVRASEAAAAALRSERDALLSLAVEGGLLLVPGGGAPSGDAGMGGAPRRAEALLRPGGGPGPSAPPGGQPRHGAAAGAWTGQQAQPQPYGAAGAHAQGAPPAPYFLLAPALVAARRGAEGGRAGGLAP